MTMTSSVKKPPMTDQTNVDAREFMAPVYGEWPNAVFVNGSGCELITNAGESFLDMTSGIAVLALGHRSPIVENAIRRASDELIHTSNLYLTRPAVQLAKELVRLSFADRVFFCNSGAEANEGAIKFARLAAGEGRSKVVYFENSFHGRTFGSLSATDKEAIRTPFEPLVPDYLKLPWGDSTALDGIDNQTACVIVEPVQGEGGVRPAPDAWIQDLRKRCDDVGACLVFDEVQCGLGRTGRLFAYENFSVTPDLLALAKPLAGGLPMGAVLMREEISNKLHAGCHGTTFGGGPLVASVALAVVKEIADEDFLEVVSRNGQWFMRQLREIESPYIEEVSGLGLMCGVRVNVEPKRIVKAAWDSRLLITAAGKEMVRFLPPLNATRDELKEGIERFTEALQKVSQS